jgi:hypothetical protein
VSFLFPSQNQRKKGRNKNTPLNSPPHYHHEVRRKRSTRRNGASRTFDKSHIFPVILRALWRIKFKTRNPPKAARIRPQASRLHSGCGVGDCHWCAARRCTRKCPFVEDTNPVKRSEEDTPRRIWLASSWKFGTRSIFNLFR